MSTLYANRVLVLLQFNIRRTPVFGDIVSKIRTNIIILRKTPFQDTGLILAGLSAELGRVDVLVKGARSVGGKKSTIADLFRVIGVEVNPKCDGLQATYSLELIEVFDDIALRHESYLDACAISEFALRNSHPGVACPEFHLAVKLAFSRLSREKCANSATLVKLAFLDEHGFLPEADPGHPDSAQLLTQLVHAAKGMKPIPNLPTDYMIRFSQWIDTLCSYHEL